MAATKISAAKNNSKSNGFENPFREGGSYWAVCECLRQLGMGKMHHAKAIIAKMPAVMGKAWKDFKSKEKRNENGLDCNGRILTNCIVVNRQDYGQPLRMAGYEVAKNRTEDGYQFGLMRLSPAAVKEAKSLKIERTPKAAPAKLAKGSKAKARKVAPKVVKSQKPNQPKRKAAK